MDWQDRGIILAVRTHGETSAILELFTRANGRHLGLIRGGRSRTKRPVLQPGNVVQAEWRARLSEHLGTYTVELLNAHAALALDDRTALAGLNTLTALARLLPERDPHEGLFDATLVVLDHISDQDIWPSLLVRWELELLNELGFGLDLETCAATGASEDLLYVSPKTGRAVSRDAGAPYKDRLFSLPSFLVSGPDPAPELADIVSGFALTGFFLEKHVLGPRNMNMPEARSRLVGALETRAEGLSTSRP
ncbi:MAG: DNA repair protein RecO [Hyphomicrobiales bacterium]|nr:DNA repair protein RecO [Hyphomicrobiales bacterium]